MLQPKFDVHSVKDTTNDKNTNFTTKIGAYALSSSVASDSSRVSMTPWHYASLGHMLNNIYMYGLRSLVL